MKRAIVLSGGGAKGSYQIGVWKALKKLHIDYDIVTGTSVGALNGLLMVQKDYLTALWMWYHINSDLIFNDQQVYDVHTKEGVSKLINKYAKSIFKEGGIEVTKLEDTIKKVMKPNKFYRSSIDYGLITVNSTTLKPMSLAKKEIPPNQLGDYLMASATCFPAFKQKTIGAESYIDGGYFDNLPINLAIDLGATEVIAVDLKAIGLKQKVKDKSIPIITISPRNRLGSFLAFDAKLARQGMTLGYFDTLKTFDQLDGDHFTFKKGQLKKHYDHFRPLLENHIHQFFSYQEVDLKWIDELCTLFHLQKLINEKREMSFIKWNHWLEYLGDVFALPPDCLYTIKSYHQVIKKALEKTEVASFSLISKKIKKKEVIDLLNTKYIIKYFYEAISDCDDEIKRQSLLKKALLFSKEWLSAYYLFVLFH